MANQHDTPGFNAFKRFSFNFHALISASMVRACGLGMGASALSAECGLQKHLPPDRAASGSLGYPHCAHSAARLFLLYRFSIVRQCTALFSPGCCVAGAWPVSVAIGGSCSG